MQKGICSQTLIPVRETSSETAEMVTQLLFGETFSILENLAKWTKIKTDFDHYEGWIDAKLVSELDEEFLPQVSPENSKVTDKLLCTARRDDIDGLIYLLMGSNLYNLQGNEFYLQKIKYELSYPLNTSKSNKAEIVLFTALQMLNIPYLWGGRSSFGIDCSGLVQTAYKVAGINMPRDASQQINMGEVVADINEVKSADLAFFENPEGKIIHTGIFISPEKIVHASGSVRTDFIDKNGIFNVIKKEYTHKLKTIKRVAYS